MHIRCKYVESQTLEILLPRRRRSVLSIRDLGPRVLLLSLQSTSERADHLLEPEHVEKGHGCVEPFEDDCEHRKREEVSEMVEDASKARGEKDGREDKDKQ